MAEMITQIKIIIEGTVITAMFWLAAIMDGTFDGIEPLRQLRMNFDMALYWAIQEALKAL